MVMNLTRMHKGRPKRSPGREPGLPPSPLELSRLELFFLKMLWERETATVRDLYQALPQERPLAYTTVLTVLDRMHAKGAVRRRKNGKTFFYQPALSFPEARRQVLAALLEFYFEGSAEKLTKYLEEQRAAAGAVAEFWGEISEELL